MDPLTSQTPSSSIPLAQRKRHEHWWLEDGSVVLATPQILFCVHRSALARHSPFFQDMFSLPAACTSADEMLEGKPVVEVHDDPDQLAIFLQALHDPFFYREDKKTDFEVVLALLRLGTKYGVDQLRQQAIAQLNPVYPDTLADLNSYLSKFYGSGYPEFITSGPDDDCVTIALFQETGLLRFLPAAYYWAAVDLYDDDYVRMSALRPVGLREVVRRGIGRLQEAKKRVVWGFVFEGAPDGCEAKADTRRLVAEMEGGALAWGGRQSCRDVFNEFIEDLYGWRLEKARGSPHVFGPSIWNAMLASQDRLCKVCFKELKRSKSAGIREVWEALPGYFGLPDWETLKRESMG